MVKPFLILVQRQGKRPSASQPSPRYIEPKQWQQGNSVLEVSPDLMPDFIPDCERSFFRKPEDVTAIWFALVVTITCHSSHERLAACLPASINQKANK